jgi:adenine/guanine/hypoxanthine permease
VNRLDRFFQLTQSETTVKKEVMAGLTTFGTMAYIIFVNPSILAQAGIDFGAAMVATAIGSAIACLIMGIHANYPFALAPSMGINAYFVYSVVQGQGVPWQVALGAVFFAALFLFVLNLFRVRQLTIQAIPVGIRLATTAGIGLFLAFIGLKNSGLVVPHPATFVALGDITNPSCYLTGLGVVVISALFYFRVRAAMLIGLLMNWVIGLGMGLITWRGVVSLPPSIRPTLFQLDLTGALQAGGWVIVISVLFISLFDAAGTLIGIAERGGFIDAEGRLPRVTRAFTADSVGGMAGALLGTTTLTVYLESMSGIMAGGRTGLTAVVVALLLLAALFFEPLASSIPPFATSPALIIVGAMMLTPIARINWDDMTELVPAFIVLLTIPLTYSIATGIALGMITFPLMKLVTGQGRQVYWLTWCIAALFAAKFIFFPG